MVDDRLGIYPDRVDRADGLEIIGEPAHRGRRTACLETVDELGNLLGTQGIRSDRVSLDRRPDFLEVSQVGTDGEIVSQETGMVN